MSDPMSKALHSAIKDFRQNVIEQKEYINRGKKKKIPNKFWHVYYKPMECLRVFKKNKDEWACLRKFASKECAEKWIEKSLRKFASVDKNDRYKLIYKDK